MSSGFLTKVLGTQGAIEALSRIRDGAGRATSRGVSIQSRLPYAFGIETGHHRNGTLARRAGGAFYLKGALDAVGPTVVGRVAGALDGGADMMERELTAIEQDLVTQARQLAPVRTGNLRDSITPGRGQ